MGRYVERDVQKRGGVIAALLVLMALCGPGTWALAEYTADIALSLNYAALHDKTKLPMPRKDDDGNVIPGSTEYQTADANNPDHMEYLQKQQPRQMLVQVLKNRMNEPGGKLYLAFDAAHSKFTPIDRHTEAPTTNTGGWTVVDEPTPFED